MSKKLLGSILVLLVVSFPQLGWGSQPWEGMDVVKYCTGDTVLFDDTTCRAYIQGVVDTHEYYQLNGKHPKSFCVPEDKAKREHGESLVPKWLAAFDERWHQKPDILIIDALNAIFPCPGK